MAATLSTALRNTLADAVGAAVDAGSAAGTISIYDGTMPASPDDAVTTQVLLTGMTLADPSFGAAIGGTATANAIAADSAADASGTATWARIADSGGNAVIDLDVGEDGSGAALILNTTDIVIALPVSISTLSVTMPGA